MLKLLRKADLAVDLGTSKIAVFVRGEGLVLEEPACIAFRRNTHDQESVIAVGHEAEKMDGKTPHGSYVVRPIQDGVITNCHVAGKLLQSLLKKHDIGTRFGSRRFLVGTLFGASSMERRSFEQVALAAGAKDVLLIPEPFAATIGAGLPIEEPRASMVVDVGGGATEALVVSLKNIVSGDSIRIGGDAMNEAIIQHLSRHVGLNIGTLEAKRLKERAASSEDLTASIQVRGIDIQRRRPIITTVRIGDLQKALQPSLIAITNMVKNVIDNLPAELSADLLDHGIVLTGGGAAIEPLRKSIERITQVSVKSLQEPQQAVINGCGKMLDYFDHISPSVLSNKMAAH
jgi:rod shape-determining protein MreB